MSNYNNFNSMSTYRAQFTQLQSQGLAIHFKQNASQAIIKCSKPSPSNYPQSQTGLYLDISLRQSSDHNWPSFENYLKEIFEQIVQLENYPNSAIKIYVFIVDQGKQIKACIINGLFLLLLKLGINMKKSIYCWEKSSNDSSDNQIESQNLHRSKDHRIVYNLNDINSIIEGEIACDNIRSLENNQSLIQNQANNYKTFVIETLKSTLYH